ncbi:MAG: alanine racemase [Parcubacteria bacterium C7867-004]|nr:MAG: alanine racemase [Parcubacteria bacterium C7867-004]
MNIRHIIKGIRKTLAYHEPLITVSISKKNLLHNLHAYQERYPDIRIAPVLKSNAYGHGLIPVAEILDTEDIAFFAVDSLYEAEKLRRSGIRSRITVMGYVRPEYIADSSIRNVDYAITDIEQLRELSRLADKSVRLHIKLDTGMHRHGILPTDLEEAIALLEANTHLRVVGVCSHFADADNVDPSFSNQQIASWKKMLAMLDAAFRTIEYRHLAATKGIRFSDSSCMNTARIGMGLFGYDMSPVDEVTLLPVLEMRALITSIREIPEGDAVGYNTTFRAKRASRIATVPVGYFEGVDRGLSNRGSFMVNGKEAPIAGRVSMNMTSIDVTDIPDAKRGDTVVIIGRDPEKPNSIAEIAKLDETSPYVITVHIAEHLRRVVE